MIKKINKETLIYKNITTRLKIIIYSLSVLLIDCYLCIEA